MSLFDPPTNRNKDEQTTFTQLDWGQ